MAVMGFETTTARSAAAGAQGRIVWHFGFQKTGTTAIQSVCWRNMEVLSQSAAVFPKRQWTEALRGAARAYLDKAGSEEAVSEAAEAIAAEVLASGQSTALVSDENVLGVDIYNEHGTIFDFVVALIPLVEQAVRPLASEFVFYTRPMESWLQSAHAQAVAWTRMTEEYDSWRAGVPFDADWDAQHKRLQALTDAPVTFRDMTQDAAEGRMLGAYLFDRSGITQEVQSSLTPARGGNERLAASARDFMLQMNRSKLNDRQLNIVRRQVLKNMHLFAPDGEG